MARTAPRGAAKSSPVKQHVPVPQGTVESKVVKITPKMAEEWLGRNSHNRPIRNTRVEELVGAIERGEWMVNGDAIRFAADGSLLDGQHRLWAIALAGKPVESVVTTGLATYAQETMDLGARRNLRDALTLRGEVNANMVAAIVALKWRLDQGLIRTTRKPTVAQGIAVLDAHPALREAKAVASRANDRFKVSGAVVGVCWYEFASIDGDAADAFFDKLVTGTNLMEGSPILALRRHLERMTAAGTGARANALQTHALFIKAWNAYREGRHVDNLIWRAAGTNAEPFPAPK